MTAPCPPPSALPAPCPAPQAALSLAGALPGGVPASGEARKQQILKQQRWLLFLRHCARCQLGEGQCQYGSNCAVAKELWNHLMVCKQLNCNFPRCCRRWVVGWWVGLGWTVGYGLGEDAASPPAARPQV